MPSEDVEEPRVGAPSDNADPPPVRPGLYARWKRLGADPLWFSLIALGLGLRAQSILTPNGRPGIYADITAAARWYALAIAILLIGWWGTERTVALYALPRLHGPALWRWARPGRVAGILTAWAVACNVVAILILRTDWSSRLGFTLWLGSVILVMAAFWREPAPPLPDDIPPREGTNAWAFPRRVELAVFVAIMLLAFIMRVWRLGDLAPGMHGDEGEAGTQALAILNGHIVSPFLRGWFNQPNVYYWTLAIFMKVFGTGLFGLRSFALVCGMVTVAFVYLLAREMFGTRAAIAAATLIAVASADLIFSRQEFSNTTLPPLFTMGFYFVVRGVRTRHHLDWVWAGLLSGWALYYFAGGRLVAPVIGLFLVYLVARTFRFLPAYWSHLAAFAVAVLIISSPFIGYYLAVPIPTNSYPNDRFIWLHHDTMSHLYGTTDWPRIVWGQLQRTLSIITFSSDNSAMSALDFPIARPLEAVLIVLGLVWAAARWLDARYALLSIWFWTSILMGGVITVDAPNLPRILGMLPALAIIMGVMLDRIAAQLAASAAGLRIPRLPGDGAQWVGGIAVAAALAVSAGQNWQMWISYYLNTHQNPVVTAQAMYVQQKGTAYRFYGMGAPIIYWTHGDNRFINPTADGIEAANPAQSLPIIDNGPHADKDAAFLVWPSMYDYLPVLEAYYPGGRQETVRIGDPAQQLQPLYGFVVPHSEINRHRTVLARYTSLDGRSVSWRATALGTAGSSSALNGFVYPVRAQWSGGLVAPGYGTYAFRLRAPAGTTVTIDGVTVFPARGGRASLVMAAGPHAVRMSGLIGSPRTVIALQWGFTPGAYTDIPRQFLWDDHTGRSWLGRVVPGLGLNPAQPFGPPQARVDGFLGYRNAQTAFGPGGSLTGSWNSILTVHTAGNYRFSLNANGPSDLLIDGRLVIHAGAPGGNPLQVDGGAMLAPGRHRVTVRYTYELGFGYLELWWTPPGHARTLMLSPDLVPPGPAVWRPGTVAGPPGATLPITPTPETGPSSSSPGALPVTTRLSPLR